MERLEAVCRPFGLILTDENGQSLDSDACRLAIKNYVRTLVTKHVRRKDGQPIKEVFVYRILCETGLMEDAPPGSNREELRTRFETLKEQVVHEQFGTEDAFQARLNVLIVRIAGLYNVSRSQTFHYTLKMPGRIIATNGLLLEADEVDWTFQNIDAFPLGYKMECRSLAVDNELQRKLLGRLPLDTLAKQRQFVDLAKADEGLRDALNACARQDSIQPLLDYRNKATEEDSAVRVRRLVQLLGDAPND